MRSLWMNDFTKDELIALQRSWTGNECLISLSDMIALESKIQSMIDSYCDHELNGIDGVTGQQCIKCKEWFD